MTPLRFPEGVEPNMSSITGTNVNWLERKKCITSKTTVKCTTDCYTFCDLRAVLCFFKLLEIVFPFSFWKIFFIFFGQSTENCNSNSRSLQCMLRSFFLPSHNCESVPKSSNFTLGCVRICEHLDSAFCNRRFRRNLISHTHLIFNVLVK